MTNHPDQEAIQAVRTGDLDRFRELIERYERHVYAVAWARLGDATLAEDAVQESFIRAYRLLGWLRHPERFAGWITRIARAVSINLGLRNRRELRRRERWALDPALHLSTHTETTETHAPLGLPPDALRAAMAELPHRHRECLVLFYLEGRTVAEVAQALGIEEGALKVRLHRARHALRGRLEEQLEKSLGQLGPRRSLAPGIMSSIALKAATADPTGTSTGFLAFLGAGFAKLLPLPILFFLVPVVMVGATVGAHSWAARAERNNYRDATGIHRRLYEDERIRGQRRTAGWILAVLVPFVPVALFPTTIPYLVLALAVPAIPCTFNLVQEFRFTGRLSGPTTSTAVTIPLLLTFALSMFWNLPSWFLGVAWGLYATGMLFAPPVRRVRFDDNLFLRNRLGWLPGENHSSANRTPLTSPIAKTDLRRFARFTGRNGLFVACRQHKSGLRLKLRPVSSTWLDDLGHWLGPKDSYLDLQEDGRIHAALGPTDRDHLDRLGLSCRVSKEAESAAIETAIRNALHAHGSGDHAEALRHLGHRCSQEIFNVDPSRTGYARMQRVAAILALIYAIGMIAFSLGSHRLPGLAQAHAARLQPNPFSLDQARDRFVNLELQMPPNSHHRFDSVGSALYMGYVLPPFAALSPGSQEFLRTNGVDRPAEEVLQDPSHVLRSFERWQTLKAFCLGWQELPGQAALREGSLRLREVLSQTPPEARARLLVPEEIPISNLDTSLLHLEPVRWRVACLRKLGLLDLFPTAPLIDLLKHHQVLRNHLAKNSRFARLNPAVWKGLIATAGNEPIHETFLALSILEDLGAVSAIDREACAQGILNLHLGKGYFHEGLAAERPFTGKAPYGKSWRSISIPGDARTTHAARESLRILGALDRVPDLVSWEYRVFREQLSPNIPIAIRSSAAWNLYEATLLREQQRIPELIP